MGLIKLSTGAIETIMKNEKIEKPVFQILEFKEYHFPGQLDRIRLLLSDGVHTYCTARLPRSLNYMFDEKILEKFVVIKVVRMNCYMYRRSQKVIIPLELEVIAGGSDVGTKLGNPIPWQADSNKTQASITPTAVNLRDSTRTTKRPSPISPPSGKKFKRLTGQYSDNNKNSGRSRCLFPSSGANTKYNNATTSFKDKIPDDLSMATTSIASITGRTITVTIRARVLIKSDPHPFSNAHGDSILMFIDLKDSTGEIKLGLFGIDVDRFQDMVEANKVYYFKNFIVKTDSSPPPQINYYQLSPLADSDIIPCAGDDVPGLTFDKFTPVAAVMEHMNENQVVDILAVCKSFKPHQEFSPRTGKSAGKTLKKRELTLVDRSNKEIILTIWGSNAEKFNTNGQPVMAIKRAKVKFFQGNKVIDASCLSSSTYLINPDLPEAHSLRDWFDQDGKYSNPSTTMMGGP